LVIEKTYTEMHGYRNIKYFTCLDNFTFSCRRTAKSLLTSSCYGSCIRVVCWCLCYSGPPSTGSVFSERGTEFLDFILMTFTFKMLEHRA